MNTLLTIVLWLVLGFLVGFVFRALHWQIASKGALTTQGSNINRSGRVMRGTFGAELLLLFTLIPHPLVLVFAGFNFFQAIFSWCGLYAILGRNTCPIE